MCEAAKISSTSNTFSCSKMENTHKCSSNHLDAAQCHSRSVSAGGASRQRSVAWAPARADIQHTRPFSICLASLLTHSATDVWTPSIILIFRLHKYLFLTVSVKGIVFEEHGEREEIFKTVRLFAKDACGRRGGEIRWVFRSTVFNLMHALTVLMCE